MDEEKIKEAVSYGAASNKIEDNYLTNEEWNEIVKAIKENHDKSFIEEIVKKVRSKRNGKFR